MALGRLAYQALLLECQRSALFGHLTFSDGALALGLTGGRLGQRLRLLLSRKAQLLGLALGVGEQLIRLLVGARTPSLDVALCLIAQALDLGALGTEEGRRLVCCCRPPRGASLLALLHKAFRLDARLADDLGRLLLGGGEHLLRLLAQPGVRRVGRLREPLLEHRDAFLELADPAPSRLRLLTRRCQCSVELTKVRIAAPDELVDGRPFVPAELGHRECGLPGFRGLLLSERCWFLVADQVRAPLAELSRVAAPSTHSYIDKQPRKALDLRIRHPARQLQAVVDPRESARIG